MKIKLNSEHTDPNDVLSAIEQAFRGSRFNLGHLSITWRRGPRGRNVVDVLDIRLAEAKPYCGNHPDACEVGIGKPRRAKFLEGADWVDFNDRLNDVLDRLDVDADVASAVCNIRQGRQRRTCYTSEPTFGRQTQWVKVGSSYDYEDWCGRSGAPASDYPLGTPGSYEREVVPA